MSKTRFDGVVSDYLDRDDMRAIRRAVKYGAELLDKKYPAWFKHIDLKTLDLTNGCNCIGGQLAAFYLQSGDDHYYTQFADHLFNALGTKLRKQLFRERDVTEYTEGFVDTWGVCRAVGFTVPLDTNDLGTKQHEAAWQHLDNCWVREIRRRLREAS